jgi:hypothetical protein
MKNSDGDPSADAFSKTCFRISLDRPEHYGVLRGGVLSIPLSLIWNWCLAMVSVGIFNVSINSFGNGYC